MKCVVYLVFDLRGKALGDMLRGDIVLKVLDVSDRGYSMSSSDKGAPGFAQELAAGIKDNGALSKLIFGWNSAVRSTAGCQSE
jgi:hypothetical protein